MAEPYPSPRADPREELERLRTALDSGAETALVIETSGSTGAPKRVPQSARALLASARASAAWLDGQGQWLLCLPTRYIAGENVLVRSIAAGTEPVYLPEGHFDPGAFRDAAGAMTGESRYVSVVPTQLQRLLDAVPADAELLVALRSFDALLVGGGPTRLRLLELADELGVRVVRTYGSSETCGGCVYDGHPLPGVRLRISAAGEVEVTGPVLTTGYLDDPERIARSFAIDPDGTRWYRTGDLGTLAADGTLSISGRRDSVIISGGEKVLLELIEEAVTALPGLADAVVVALDDDEWGQVPVVVTTGTADLAGVRAAVGGSLGRAAQPARVITVAGIPLLPSGKPDRQRLAADLSSR